MQEISKGYLVIVKNALRIANLTNYPEEKLLEIIKKINPEKILLFKFL